jgi:hypothetical protein
VVLPILRRRENNGASMSANEMRSFCRISDLRRAAEDFCDNDFSKTLFVFDLDLTLVKPLRAEASYASLFEYQHLIMDIVREFSDEQKDEFFNIGVTAEGIVAVEDDTIDALRFFHDSGASVIALTAALTGDVGNFEMFEEFRYKQCVDLGLQFSDVCNEEKFAINLTEFRGNKPIYKNGIIFGNGVRGHIQKGDILGHFIPKMKFLPTKIIFADDLQENVESVFSVISNLYPGIKLLSARYTGGSISHGYTNESAFTSYWLRYRDLVSTGKY